MIRHIYILSIAILALSIGCNRDTVTTEKTSIKGVWLTNVGSRAMFSREGIEEAVERCVDCGINTIYCVTWNRGYTMYPSKLMERKFGVNIDPKFGSRDPLKELIVAAHKRDIRVVAWFEFGFSYRYMDEGNRSILDSNPDWISLDSNGEPAQKNNFYWMNAFNPEVQQFIIDMVVEVIDNYDIDGIQGDDRLPALPSLAGYDPYTIELFKKEHGGRVPPEDYKSEEWVQWRCDKLTDFLGELYRAVKRADESCMVSMAPSIYPWSKYEYLQDWPTWVVKGYVDHLAPQIYRYDIESYSSTLENNGLKYISKNNFELINPGVLLKVEGYSCPDSLLEAVIDVNRAHNIGGENFFYYEGLSEHKSFFKRYREDY